MLPPGTETVSKSGVDLIKSFEGLRLTAYRDPAGILTIGHGHTGPDVHPGQQITMARADRLFLEDVWEAEDAVISCVEVPVTQEQFDALVSFAFNVGVGALRESTLLKMLNDQNFNGAAHELGRWTRAGKIELAGLVKRRAAEQEMFRGSHVA